MVVRRTNLRIRRDLCPRNAVLDVLEFEDFDTWDQVRREIVSDAIINGKACHPMDCKYCWRGQFSVYMWVLDL